MLGLIANTGKMSARRVLRAMMNELQSQNMPFVLESATAEKFGHPEGMALSQLEKKCSMLIVLGGDGTLLRTVHSLGTPQCPVFGINLGSLGFLTAASPADIPGVVASIRDKSYILSKRTLIKAEILSTGKNFHALNDVVLGRGARPALVKLSLAIAGVPLTGYNADGLIVATPTGSTAYSLSAGGPILSPESGCFVITPICPHALSSRPFVVNEQSAIEITVVEKGQEVVLTVDGQDITALRYGDTLRVVRSSRTCPLAMLHSFPEILRAKLKWRGSSM